MGYKKIKDFLRNLINPLLPAVASTMSISTKECVSHMDDVRVSVENLLNVIESKANLIGAETFVEKVDGKFKITIQCNLVGLEKFMYRVSSPTPFDEIPS